MTLLQGLHSIAAQRGDGLLPELLALSPARFEIERMRNAVTSEDIGGAPAEMAKPDVQSAEIVAMPLCMRGRRWVSSTA
ncbi:hypothetical protein LJR030_002682 [Rhizobium sp. LjRoot30]|uniref:hypothetical protein n=1 Tax=Rhizobium sp. LjRoot30 TaxID=3342320 RepID=UPI003ECC8D46